MDASRTDASRTAQRGSVASTSGLPMAPPCWATHASLQQHLMAVLSLKRRAPNCRSASGAMIRTVQGHRQARGRVKYVINEQPFLGASQPRGHLGHWCRHVSCLLSLLTAGVLHSATLYDYVPDA
ncbi:hypothetical protein NDU88_002029 [Pleurodeles waltl]|uniref:Uncharacterized protein n=1 Tax=Pleurodeles waltl TaxID=8319 RepID=A0AAV7MNE6_PLEWA|nr:hypothetical protein NDU88_002029 [Pleurodeles waltl]